MVVRTTRSGKVLGVSSGMIWKSLNILEYKSGRVEMIWGVSKEKS